MSQSNESKRLIFLPWNGGSRPINPDVHVVVKGRNGTLWEQKARFFEWQHNLDSPQRDIVEYAIMPDGYSLDEMHYNSNLTFK